MWKKAEDENKKLQCSRNVLHDSRMSKFKILSLSPKLDKTSELLELPPALPGCPESGEKCIGAGRFGTCKLMNFCGIPAAVKQFQDSSSTLERHKFLQI